MEMTASALSLAVIRPANQGVLVAPVTGQVHAAEQGRLLVEGGNDLPSAVFGAVVDKEHPALFADFPCGDKLFQLGLQALGGLGQDLLLIVTGYDDI